MRLIDMENHPISDIKDLLMRAAVIGEYTTSAGPMLDDHFLVVVTESGEWMDYPANQAAKIINEIEGIKGKKIDFQLCNRTDFQSRVIFPSRLLGRPLFDFSIGPLRRQELWRCIKTFGACEVSLRLTEEIHEYLRKQRH